MIIDLKKKSISESKSYDLCIVGAGAAGITIAKEFANSRYNVSLVESGDFNFDNETQKLYEGKTKGNISQFAQYDVIDDFDYLKLSRLRYFGGTTNHWGGWCRPLDNIDFKYRDWVPDSGWPITKKELSPFYKRAEEITEINSFEELEQRKFLWGKDNKLPICAPFFQFSKVRFGNRYRDNITNAQNIDLYLNANLSNIALTDNRRRVNYLKLRSLNDKYAIIRADLVILACGAIENARILLNCKDDLPKGLGNENDLVGKYFMEHPHFYKGGKLLTWSWDLPHKFEKLFGQWHEFRRRAIDGVMRNRVITLTEEAQEKHKLLNISFEVTNFAELNLKANPMADALANLSEFLLDPDKMFNYPFMPIINIRAEQQPRKANSVSLSAEKDELGMQKVKLVNNITPQEIENYMKSLQILGKSLGLSSRNISRLQLNFNKESVINGAPHHMGTTRMSKNPSNGVVDINCKIHSLDNLFIAGSSVFPTVGYANPTFTIVALALRLSDHIKDLLKHEG